MRNIISSVFLICPQHLQCIQNRFWSIIKFSDTEVLKRFSYMEWSIIPIMWITWDFTSSLRFPLFHRIITILWKEDILSDSIVLHYYVWPTWEYFFLRPSALFFFCFWNTVCWCNVTRATREQLNRSHGLISLSLTYLWVHVQRIQ